MLINTFSITHTKSILYDKNLKKNVNIEILNSQLIVNGFYCIFYIHRCFFDIIYKF